MKNRKKRVAIDDCQASLNSVRDPVSWNKVENDTAGLSSGFCAPPFMHINPPHTHTIKAHN